MIHGDFGTASIRPGFTGRLGSLIGDCTCLSEKESCIYFFSAKYCNELTRIAIIRVRHGPHQLVSSILPLITSIGKYKVTLRTLYVGATLKNCYKRIIVSILPVTYFIFLRVSFLTFRLHLQKHQKTELAKMVRTLKDPSAKPELEKKMLEIKDVFNFKKIISN